MCCPDPHRYQEIQAQSGGMKKAKTSKGKDIQETLNFIVDRMVTKGDLKDFATKDDVREIVGEKLKPVTDEMRSMRTDIKELKESVDNLKGLTQENDHILTRVSAIEKHIGFQPQAPVDA